MNRRYLLVALGSTSAALAVRYSSGSNDSESGPSDGAEDPFDSSADCVLATTEIEGPYFLEDALIRKDIRDDRPGQELRLRIRVVDVNGCQPISDATVSIWHCDAGGYYSGHLDVDPDAIVMSGDHLEPTSDERFLRGAQRTDQKGEIEFTTIYPGWYAGRTVHIHFKVLVSDTELVTGQMYCPQELSNQIHATGPYIERGKSPVTNTNDFIIDAENDPDGSWPTMTTDNGVLVGTLTIGVQR